MINLSNDMIVLERKRAVSLFNKYLDEYITTIDDVFQDYSKHIREGIVWRAGGIRTSAFRYLLHDVKLIKSDIDILLGSVTKEGLIDQGVIEEFILKLAIKNDGLRENLENKVFRNEFVDGVSNRLLNFLHVLRSKKYLVLHRAIGLPRGSGANKRLSEIMFGRFADVISNAKEPSFVRRFLQCTDWNDYGDIDVKMIWDSMRENPEWYRQRSHIVSPSRFLIEVSKRTKGIISRVDIKVFKRFGGVQLNSSDIAGMTYSEIKEYVEQERTYGVTTQRKGYGEHGNKVTKVFSEVSSKLKNAAERNAITEYVSLLGPIRRIEKNWADWAKTVYVGREITDEFLESISEWTNSIDAYITSLKGTDETISSKRSLLNILADYLLCYLPWWFELHPRSKFTYPSKPSLFKRSVFWNAELLKGRGIERPMTLVEFYELRRSKWTTTQIVNVINGFFGYVISELNDAEELVGFTVDSDFVNPVNRDIDSKRKNKKRFGTDKIALPLRTMPTVIAVFDALERVAINLQERFMKGEEFGAAHGKDVSTRTVDLDLVKLGVDVSVDVPEYEPVKLESIPNVFNWFHTKEKRLAPIASNLRMLRTNLHAGQRMRNIRWLDINTFDEDVPSSSDSYLCPLTLPVDKINPGRRTLIPRFIMESLVREREFQKAWPDNDFVVYEYKYADEIVKVTPLFRNPFHKLQKPFSETNTNTCWVLILSLIERLFNQYYAEGEPHTFVYEGNKRKDENNLLPVHTPHSMRNTYALYRKELVDLKLLMDQAGWNSEVMPFHYAKAQPRKQLEKLLEHADKVLASKSSSHLDTMLHDSTLFDTESRLNAASKSAAIREMIETDVAQAIVEQNMISLEGGEISEYKGKNGLERLRTQKITEIAYYAHCLCPAGGNCPLEVMESIEERQRCGLCPIACFGIDHVSGIYSKIRSIVKETEIAQNQLELLQARKDNPDAQTKIKKQIRLNILEKTALYAVSQMLINALDRKIPSKYVARKPDLVAKAVRISVNNSTKAGEFLSELADANHYPEFMSPDFLMRINRMSRQISSYDLEHGKNSDTVSVVSSYIASVMRVNGVTLNELANDRTFLQLTKMGDA